MEHLGICSCCKQLAGVVKQVQPLGRCREAPGLYVGLWAEFGVFSKGGGEVKGDVESFISKFLTTLGKVVFSEVCIATEGCG